MSLLSQQVRDPAAQLNFEQISKQIGQSTVATLPNTARDGQEVAYLADDTNGVVWRLKYRAGSASTYKWEFIGGANLFKEVTPGLETTASTTYVALTTALTLTLPLAGDYDVTLEFGGYHSVAGGTLYMSYDIGGTGAVDADSALCAEGVAATDQHRAVKTRRKTIAAAATTLTCKHRTSGATATFGSGRSIRATPVRVG